MFLELEKHVNEKRASKYMHYINDQWVIERNTRATLNDPDNEQ